MMDKLDRPNASVGGSEIVLSLPEVNALCTNAARGAGYSWGLSEECGHASAWLAAHGFAWAPVLIRRLNGDRGGEVAPAPGAWAARGPLCALHAGTALADFATLPEGPGGGGVVIGDVLDPLILLPFAWRAARLAGLSLCCTLNGAPWVALSAGSVTEIEPSLTGTTLSKCALRPIGNPPVSDAARVHTTTSVSNDDYAELSATALRMTVPATAASETRAGGTGSDND